MRHLKAFHVFHIAATVQSYTEAASKLNITHGAVSKQIKVLESYLEKKLFYRQGRHVHLTHEGQLLADYTQRAFGALDEGVAQLSKLNQTHLDVSCEPTLTMRWLMPRLAAFNLEHQADVRLSTAGGPINLGENGLAMAIRRDDFAIPSDYQVTPLVHEWVGPVCSPDYWRKVQNDLTRLTLLHTQTRPNAWQDWLKVNGADSAELSKRSIYQGLNGPQAAKSTQSFAHFYFSLQAAQDGLGMAMGSYPLVQDELIRGNLMAPFGFVDSGHRYILLSQAHYSSPLEQAFKQWLVSAFANCIPAS